MIAFEDAKITKYFVFMRLILGFTKNIFCYAKYIDLTYYNIKHALIL